MLELQPIEEKRVVLEEKLDVEEVKAPTVICSDEEVKLE